MDQKNIIAYLEKNVPNFKINKRTSIPLFTCPYCGKHEVCRFVPGSNKINCMACGNMDDIVGLAKHFGDVSFEDTDETITDRLRIDLGLENDKDKLKLLEDYQKAGFDLTPLQKNTKVPFELDWVNTTHKDITDWQKWLGLGMNIGVKCGTRSGITIIDIDQETIPADIELMKGEPVIQKTGRGWHYIYKYTDLPTTSVPEYKIDVLNNGKQAVMAPSVIIDKETGAKQTRAFTTPFVLKDMPDNLKKLLASKIDPVKPLPATESDIVIDESVPLNLIDSGGRNNALIQLGGILSKELNSHQVEFAVSVLNQKLCNPPLSNKELYTINRSLDKYIRRDEKNLAHQIWKYVQMVEFANSREIKDALGFPKEDIDKALAYLVKEQRLMRKGRNFSIIRRADWKETLSINQNNIDFFMPYFGDYVNLCYGDMVLLGSKSKYGKTTIAMNIIRELNDQGKKPYYISLEAGSRFAQTAMALGIKEGDFKWDFVTDPSKIQLEDNAITIIDWLLIEDKAQTDTVMKYFVEQLYKTSGFLIVFVQLKEDGSYFAPNMTKQFPALAARYLYTDDNVGVKGQWQLDAIRDPKKQAKTGIIQCEYDWQTKTLKEIKC